MSDTPDLLRIIAGEPERLSQQDRESIRLAAHELELAERGVAALNGAVADLHQQMAALMERNGELQRRVTDLECQVASDACTLEGYRAKEDNRQVPPLNPDLCWSMGSGWCPVRGYLE